MKSKGSWLQKFFNKEKKLENFLEEIKLQKNTIEERRNCFLFFLDSELASIKTEIENKLAENKIINIQVPEQYGFFHFVQKFLFQYPIRQKIYLKVVPIFQSAEQIALILLKELKQKPSFEPLNQLQNYLKEKETLIILESIKNINADELNILLQSLKSAKIILINYNKINISFDNLHNIEISALSSERAGEFAFAMLKLRNDLIITSADKKEIMSLIDNCNKFPEQIFIALSILETQSSSSVGAYSKKTKNLLTYLMQKQFPPEINYLLQIAFYLPVSGFTENDLIILCNSFISSKEDIPIILFFLQKAFCIRNINGLYQMPDYLREYLENNSIEMNNINLNTINNLLSKRIESDYLWKEKNLWISQLEQALIMLYSIYKNKNFSFNQYSVLYIQTILMELGFWKLLHNILIPLSTEAIKNSDNNEDRGFWYSLLGLCHLGIAKFQNPVKQLESALHSFQKSLKFYNPQKQPKRYSFVYQNIGLAYNELYKNTKSQSNLKLSIKAYYKALNEDDNSITIRRLLAQNYAELAQYEKLIDNYQKSFDLYKQALYQLSSKLKNTSSDISTDSRARLIYLELENLYKSLNTEETLPIKEQVKELLKIQMKKK